MMARLASECRSHVLAAGSSAGQLIAQPGTQPGCVPGLRSGLCNELACTAASRAYARSGLPGEPKMLAKDGATTRGLELMLGGTKHAGAAMAVLETPRSRRMTVSTPPHPRSAVLVPRIINSRSDADVPNQQRRKALVRLVGTHQVASSETSRSRPPSDC